MLFSLYWILVVVPKVSTSAETTSNGDALEITSVTICRACVQQRALQKSETKCDPAVSLHELSVLRSRPITGRCPAYCRIWVGAGWCRQGCAWTSTEACLWWVVYVSLHIAQETSLNACLQTRKGLNRPEKLRWFPSVQPLHDLSVPRKGTGGRKSQGSKEVVRNGRGWWVEKLRKTSGLVTLWKKGWSGCVSCARTSINLFTVYWTPGFDATHCIRFGYLQLSWPQV